MSKKFIIAIIGAIIFLLPITSLWLLGVVVFLSQILSPPEHNVTNIFALIKAIFLFISGGLGLVGVLSLVWSLRTKGTYLVKPKISKLLALLGMLALFIALVLSLNSETYLVAILLYGLPMVYMGFLLFICRDN